MCFRFVSTFRYQIYRYILSVSARCLCKHCKIAPPMLLSLNDRTGRPRLSRKRPAQSKVSTLSMIGWSLLCSLRNYHIWKVSLLIRIAGGKENRAIFSCLILLDFDINHGLIFLDCKGYPIVRDSEISIR